MALLHALRPKLRGPPMSPRVSLALPVYNGEKFLSEAITSILDQNYSNFELIITDNASVDRTSEISQAYSKVDCRITYIRNKTNLGAGPNFNLGFQLSRGHYFKWCAADDLLSRNFLTTCVSALDADPDAVLAYPCTESIDEHGRPIPLAGLMMPIGDVNDAALRFRRIVFASNSACYEIFGLYRSAALRQSNLHRMYYGSDRALLAEMALLGKLVNVPGATFYNREHCSRSIHLRSKQDRKAWQNTTVKRGLDFEHWRLLMHLTEIAVRHKRKASIFTTLPSLARWACTPRQVARYASELVGLLSPRLRRLAHEMILGR